MTAKTKGGLVTVRVLDCDDGAAREAVSGMREDFPGCSVRTYRRTVSADGAAVSVTVVVVREKV